PARRRGHHLVHGRPHPPGVARLPPARVARAPGVRGRRRDGHGRRRHLRRPPRGGPVPPLRLRPLATHRTRPERTHAGLSGRMRTDPVLIRLPPPGEALPTRLLRPAPPRSPAIEDRSCPQFPRPNREKRSQLDSSAQLLRAAPPSRTDPVLNTHAPEDVAPRQVRRKALRSSVDRESIELHPIRGVTATRAK